MHGKTSSTDVIQRQGVSNAVVEWFRAHKYWCIIVIFPTLIVAAYYYLIAANQYESEAHFLVRTANAPAAAPSGIGEALTMVGATSSQADAMAVSDYLTSHDAVAALQARLNLVARYRRPEADLISELWSSNPTPERLLGYYQGNVDVKVRSDSGITTLQVRSFRPEDSVAIINQLLQLSEDRINVMNRRNYDSAVAVARAQYEAAEREVEQVQGNMTSFRSKGGDFNPQTTGQAQVAMIAQLQAQVAAARAQLSAMSSTLSASAPQREALRSRVTGLEQQVAAERAKLSSGRGNVATGLTTYEGIQLRQEFVGKRYEAAATALQKASEEAAKQQLFLVKIVDPNTPVKSTYPKRAKTVATIFLALLLSYGLGWLVVAGVREHAA
jgi:capsular polysaccharide transport system permease protein